MTDRNGDNAVAGPVGNMRQLAEYLSDHGVASLRYDKVGTGRTGLGPYAKRPADVGTAVFTAGAQAAIRFLADQAGVDKDRLSVYGLGEGTTHAMALATDTAADAPKIHSLGLLAATAGPLPGPDDLTAAQPDRSRGQGRRQDAAAGRRRAGGVDRRGRPGAGQRHGAAGAAARRHERHPQSRQRQGRHRGRRRRPAGRSGQDPGRHPGAAHLFGFRRPGRLRRRQAAGRRPWRTPR